jgi:membrane protease YdiL (CAAX protease family)
MKPVKKMRGRIMIKKLIDLEHDKFGLKTVFHVLMGIVILVAGNIAAELPAELFHFITKTEPLLITVVIRPLLRIAVLLLLTCLYILKVLKLPLGDFRIRRPRGIAVWLLCAIALPSAVSAFFIVLTPGVFTVSNPSTPEIVRILLWAVFSLCLTAGITEELLFRGLIMGLLEKRWNKAIAIIVPSVLFGLLHISNMKAPSIVDIGTLVIAGTAVGVMFSLIALHSNSIWASAVVHGIWNLVIIGGILEISGKPSSVYTSMPAIYTYTLTTNSTLITGGAFGIEASLPAIIGYGLVIVLALALLKKQQSGK